LLVSLSLVTLNRYLHSFPTRRSSDLIDFFLRREAQVLPFRDLGVVINKADGRESNQRKQRHQDEGVLQVRPEQRRNGGPEEPLQDRKSTRLNSSHVSTSYAVFCLKKK